jgi:hypothetical protein
MCKDISNEGHDCADGRLSDDAICCPVHLDEKCNGGQCTYGPANRSENHMLHAERGEDIATRHNEKAGEPSSTKFFKGGADEPACAEII